jgi:hypothetical protein
LGETEAELGCDEAASSISLESLSNTISFSWRIFFAPPFFFAAFFLRALLLGGFLLFPPPQPEDKAPK